MSRESRQPDFLDAYSNVDVRVRNLETGVHPVGSSVEWFGTYGPGDLPDESPLFTRGVSEPHPRWFRRNGIVNFTGRFFGDLAAVAAAHHLSSVPEVACPPATQNFIVPSSRLPYWARIQITASGAMSIFVQPGAVGADHDIYLDNITYAAVVD